MTLVVLLAVGSLGLGTIWRCGKRVHAIEFVVLGSVIAVAFAALAGSVLLWLGLFQWWSLTAAAVSTATLGAIAFRVQDRAQLTSSGRRTSWALTGLLVLLGVLLLVTPRWNFQLDYGMDAGRYETYANYAEEAGRLYFDSSAAVEDGVPEQWLTGGNSWTVPEGQSHHLPGFGAVLGMVREALGGDPTSSSLLLMALGLVNASLLFLVARRAKAPPVTAAVIAALVVTTVMFFVYSKQVMSEQLALTGMLGFIYALQMENDGEDGWLAPILGSVGAALLAISKLDGIANIAMVVLGFWGAAQLGLRTRSSPSKRLAVGTAVALVGTTGFVMVVALPGYVAHTSLGDSIPGLAALPFSNVPLLVPMAVVSGGLLVHLAVQRSPGARTAGDGARRLRTILLVVWVLYMLYNATLRPLGETLENHNALNLVRLWALSSPVLLVAVALGSARDRELPPATRALGVGLMVAFGWGIYSSQHSPADLWWMRRYLVVLVPLFVIAGVGAARQLARLEVRSWILGAGMVMLVLAQVGRLVPFLGYEQNSSAPGRLLALESQVPSDAPLVVVAGERAIQALGVTLASRRAAVTLHDVDRTELGDALVVIDRPGVELVLSPLPLEPRERSELGLEPVADGVFSAQWADWYDDVVTDPDSERRVTRYWLYAHPDAD